MKLTQQIKVRPTKQQEDTLWKLSEKCRLIYNFALTEKQLCWELDIKGVNYYSQQNDLPKLKQKYPDYKIVYSKVLQYVLRTLNADYKSFFALWKKGDKDAKPPKYKGKKYFTTMVYNQSGFKVEQGKIILSQDYDKQPLEFEIPEKFKFAQIEQVSVYQKDNNFYISITYEKQEKEYVDNGLYQAIDLGVTNIITAVNSKGRVLQIKNKRPDKYWFPKEKKIQSRRDHCKEESKKWNKLDKNLNKMKRKSANQIRDFQHKLTRKIVDNTKSNTIIVGDLAVKKMAKKGDKRKKGLNRSIQNTGTLGRFVRFLTYKGKLVGKGIKETNEYKTSKKCCCCGKEWDMDLSIRTMKCDCGNEIDRDANSSVNIMTRFLSQNGLWTALSEFQANLRQTGIPIQVLHSQEATSKIF